MILLLEGKVSVKALGESEEPSHKDWEYMSRDVLEKV